MSAMKLAEHFSELEDPRCSGKVEHLLIDILVIAVCAVIAGSSQAFFMRNPWVYGGPVNCAQNAP